MENKPASNRLRSARYSEAQRIYLVTTATAQRAPVFADFCCARLLVRVMLHLEQTGHVRSLAFVVMPDHLHWLFEMHPGYRLEAIMHLLKGRSAREINRRHNHGGVLWQDGYHDHAVRRDQDVAALARYIVANPLRAGLVRSVREYPHWDAIWL